MTINTQSNKTIVLGNGSQTQFAFGFIGVAAAYISVIYTDADGNETELIRGLGASQYQISLNVPVAGALWGAGGTVTYNPSGTPIPSGSSLTIFRTLPLTQAVSLQNLISLSSVSNGAEMGLDTLEMQLQQVSELFQRAIVAPIVDATAPLPLPPIAQRANQGAVFDGNGNMVAGALPASGVISTAMQPVVDAATLALGRTAFGLGSIATENIGLGLADDGADNLDVLPPLLEVATNQSVTKANHTANYMANGTLVFTLPRADTLFDGFYFNVFALTGAISFVINSNDAFFGQASGASLTIPQGSFARVSTNALTNATWYAEVSGIRLTTNFIGFGSSGTYTPSAGLVFAVFEGVGGGGGGGSAPSYTGAEDGGGGGGGGYAKVTLTPAQIGGPQGVVIGVGGTGGSAGGAGSHGGNTSMGLFLEAQGGAGGGAAAGAGGPGFGGAAGDGVAGDEILPGQDGTAGYFSGTSSPRASGGAGGSSHLGFGGIGPGAITSGSANSGNSGKSYGGGGAGGSINNAGPANGGNGAPGVLFVTEYLYVT
jgi:hypothetical protein